MDTETSPEPSPPGRRGAAIARSCGRLVLAATVYLGSPFVLRSACAALGWSVPGETAWLILNTPLAVLLVLAPVGWLILATMCADDGVMTSERAGRLLTGPVLVSGLALVSTVSAWVLLIQGSPKWAAVLSFLPLAVALPVYVLSGFVLFRSRS